MKRKRVLFVYQNYSTFVKNDFDILSELFIVDKYQFHRVKGNINTIIGLLKQLFFLTIHIWKYDAVYIWFADYFSFLPVIFAKILNKKSFVVVGGYDVSRIRKLQYGALYKKSRGFFTVSSLKLCTVCITVSENIDRKTKYIAPKANRVLIYNCVNVEIPDNYQTKENLVLTVGNIDTEETIFVKGLDTFVEVARLMPDYKFLLIGFNKENLSYIDLHIPGNMEIYGKVANQELMSYYSRAKFYCQFSRSEAFGVAIVEAMLHGCIPVVTDAGAIPEIVGDDKYIVKRDPENIKNTILLLADNKEENIRKERAIEMFSFEKRKGNMKILFSN